MIASLVSSLFMLLIIPIMYAVGVYFPMCISGGMYRIYSTLCGADFAKSFFSGDKFQTAFAFDFHNQLFLTYFIVFMIGIGGFVIYAGIYAVSTFTNIGKKHSIGLGRTAYGLLSLFVVPFGFVFMSSIASMLVSLFNPSTSIAFVSDMEKVALSEQMESLVNNIKTHFNGFQINEPDFSIAWQSFYDSINQLIEQMFQLQVKCVNLGDNDSANALALIISDLRDIEPMCKTDWWDNYLRNFENCLNSVNVGERSDEATYNAMNDLMSQLSNFDLKINHMYSNLSNFLSQTVSNDVKTSVYYNFVRLWFENFNDETKGLVYVIFTNDSNVYSWLEQILYTGSSGIGADSYGFYTINRLLTEMNPVTEFKTIINVYQYVTGSNSTNWQDFGPILAGSFRIDRLGSLMIGAMCVSILMGAMIMYAWYVIKRIFDIIVLWGFSIYVAFTDWQEGAVFRKVIKMIFFKYCSIIIIQACFNLFSILSNLKVFSNLIGNTSGWVNHGAYMLLSTMMIGTGYYSADMLCGYLLNEPGTLRGVADQMNSARSSGQSVEADSKGALQRGEQGVQGSVSGVMGQLAMRSNFGGGKAAPAPAPGGA